MRKLSPRMGRELSFTQRKGSERRGKQLERLVHGPPKNRKRKVGDSEKIVASGAGSELNSQGRKGVLRTVATSERH